jgi:hypothetical protein
MLFTTMSLTGAEIDKILSILSPFENTKRSAWLSSRFQQDLVLERGELGIWILF